MVSREREFDLVLQGATGFTGGLTAEYLAHNAPTGLRWALAGRNAAKLERVRDRLAATTPGLAQLPLVRADSSDRASLDALAGRTRMVATTVGPYVKYGEPLVAACAAAGTDYVDITGEPEFVDRMYVFHHETAVGTGARIVHACGFDSVPADLGAYFTLQQMQATEPVRLRGVVRASGTVSGGTLHSALGAFSRAKQARDARTARRQVEPRLKEGRRSKAVAGKPHRDPVLGYWLVPLPTLDPAVVARSAAALEAYGPDFRYSHFAGTRTLRYAAGGIVGASALAIAAQAPPLRRRLEEALPAGSGPSPSRRANAWFTVDFVAETSGRTLHTRVSGGDAGYEETAKMLSESALCLALDDNPGVAGCVTTAVAMGDNLLDRLRLAGMRFEVVGA